MRIKKVHTEDKKPVLNWRIFNLQLSIKEILKELLFLTTYNLLPTTSHEKNNPLTRFFLGYFPSSG